ncbi:glycosyltransferase family 4 protein [Rhodococcus fascians]|uniref:glycosyltransferase family 4 protein n=1 Tax=Rhodococcoides fascians TaxID=1828 RepID=UPI001959C741|nr:glycosyltransferase family 1 protein [Rhodococcus fascians]MBM7242504.1 glycosyltransferase family 4 protein [Rhodococcus fascians]MBY3809729.1 glycosyltransferase family 4 protein [Rhodococcus fascians]MBY3840652.1 glycosyltransferase family 4 protein [Rhodococcus fascians]MBY3847143.1 glycosyltransferase family 4 protein [Rhodococcus fascians]MBY3849720.1 glycosyltransferase family 4 protein [Rhodococcus fascians]
MRSSATRIVFGALALRPGGSGVQTYIRELLNELPDRLPDADLTAVVQRDAVGELPPSVRAMERPVTSGAARAVLGALPVGRCDVVHGLDVDLPFLTKAFTVATVHDLSVIDMPSASSRFRALGEQRLVRRALRRADLLIAVSQFTADRIKAVSGRDATVVGLAPAAWAEVPTDSRVDAVRSKYDLPDRFVMQVGTVEPRKNVQLVADAAESLGIPCLLAGAGSTGPHAPRNSRGLGYVDVEDLPALYAAATVTAYASRYEGYGLPPVEAMASGGAVVASAVGALPDVVGDGAVLVASENVGDWVHAMKPIAFDADARAALVGAAADASREISWRRTAELTADAYRAAGVV